MQCAVSARAHDDRLRVGNARVVEQRRRRQAVAHLAARRDPRLRQALQRGRERAAPRLQPRGELGLGAAALLDARQRIGHLAERRLDRALVAGERYRAGYSPYLEVLDAQRTANDAELAYVRNRQARLAFSVDLMKALGGGWKD